MTIDLLYKFFGQEKVIRGMITNMKLNNNNNNKKINSYKTFEINKWFFNYLIIYEAKFFVDRLYGTILRVLMKVC